VILKASRHSGVEVGRLVMPRIDVVDEQGAFVVEQTGEDLEKRGLAAGGASVDACSHRSDSPAIPAADGQTLAGIDGLPNVSQKRSNFGLTDQVDVVQGHLFRTGIAIAEIDRLDLHAGVPVRAKHRSIASELSRLTILFGVRLGLDDRFEFRRKHESGQEETCLKQRLANVVQAASG
jgi:hypothetical protein